VWVKTVTIYWDLLPVTSQIKHGQFYKLLNTLSENFIVAAVVCSFSMVLIQVRY